MRPAAAARPSTTPASPSSSGSETSTGQPTTEPTADADEATNAAADAAACPTASPRQAPVQTTQTSYSGPLSARYADPVLLAARVTPSRAPARAAIELRRPPCEILGLLPSARKLRNAYCINRGNYSVGRETTALAGDAFRRVRSRAAANAADMANAIPQDNSP